MEKLIRSRGITHIVDATHPYAVIVSENIRKAAESAGAVYYRLLRESAPVTGETVVYYNPQGGLYYHSADTCPKVASQYEPLTPLYYKDLNSGKFKTLNPCPDCGAPPRPSIVSE